MIRVECFCTKCNPSAQRRDPGDEINSGYAKTEVSRVDVTGRIGVSKPTGWHVNDDGTLVCDRCRPLLPQRPAFVPKSDESRSAPDGWPSRTSPFES